MYRLLKPLVFLLSAETAHSITTSIFVFINKIPLLNQIVTSFFTYESPQLERELWGLRFKNPIGLAAGFDKDGKYIEAMSQLGFGFIELGTVTPKPQKGNPRPRLFRLVKDRAIINRMGFNNRGVDHLVERLKKIKRRDIIIGGNIGKNKTTPNEKADQDYLYCFEQLYDYVDYFVVNLSSPNTPGLRELQEKGPLKKILNSLLSFRSGKSIRKPIVLKIAPDLNSAQLDDVIDIAIELKIDGIIATNTTISRSGLKTNSEIVEQIGAGGLSGAPLTEKSDSVLSYLHSKLENRIPVIAVGGIMNPENAKSKLDIGAELIQLYSGLIYEGPFLIKKIKKHLLSELT